MKKRIETVTVLRQLDDSPDLSFLGEYADAPADTSIDREERGDRGRGEYRYFNLGCGEAEYIEQDYARAEAYNAGQWRMIGLQAVAAVVVNGTRQTVHSGGLWGIESDSDDSFFEVVAREELATLAETLAELGFSPAAIRAALERAEHVEE